MLIKCITKILHPGEVTIKFSEPKSKSGLAVTQTHVPVRGRAPQTTHRISFEIMIKVVATLPAMAGNFGHSRLRATSFRLWQRLMVIIIRVLYLWCVARFGISHYFAFAWSFERMRMHANTFFYLHAVFIRLHELPWHSNGFIKCQACECHLDGKH